MPAEPPAKVGNAKFDADAENLIQSLLAAGARKPMKRAPKKKTTTASPRRKPARSA